MHRESSSGQRRGSAKGTPRFVSLLTRETLALILAGGRGAQLKYLTLWRALPALPFGGKFRIIDFPLSNCINSGIRRVGILTQYKSHSLIRHVHKGWGFLQGEFGEFIELYPASQRVQTSWYTGTADAVYQNLDVVRLQKPKHVLILAGDHIYKMDYGPMLAYHADTGADLTVASVEVPVHQARQLGVMEVDEDRRLRHFTEKPENPQRIPGRGDVALASMGIYVFNTDFLCEQVIRDADRSESSHDFGKDVLPATIEKHRVMAYPFRADPGQQPYWRDVGSVDIFWEANMDLISVTPQLDLYDEEWPIWTYQEQLPPAKFVFDDEDRRGMAVDSVVSGGCIVSGALLRRSLLFSDVKVNSYTTLLDTVVLPEVEIGRDCRITKAVIDRGSRIPAGTVIGEDPDEDRQRFFVSEGGVVVVTPEMLGHELHRFR